MNKQEEKFTSISHNFAQATSMFVDNQQFAYLCSFIIENSKILITNSQKDFLINNFNRDSDIITLLESIYEYSKFIDLINYDTGISNSVITKLYTEMNKEFDSCDGREAVINAVKWSKSQPGGILAMVDKFVNILLEQKEFNQKRRYTFVHALNANFDNNPNIIFKSVDDSNSTIVIDHRIGWHKLEVPGNIIILNEDYLIHRDNTNQIENPGIVALKYNNPSLNSVFFLKLLESYLKDQDIEKDFVEIYRSPEPNKEKAFLFHIYNNEDETIFNFCPRTYAIEKIFCHINSKLIKLMPFLPYSILFNIESLGSAIEINSYGPSINYIPKILPYLDPDDNLPFAYRLCKETLEFALHNIDEMTNRNSLIRFAITGESLIYRQDQTNETVIPFSSPDISSESTSVFDQYHPSYLVLLVDKKYSDQPQIEPLPWISSPNSPKKETEKEYKKTFPLLYIPTTKEEELLLLNELVKDKDKDSTCLSMCSTPRDFLSQPLYIYQGYNKSKALSICKSCQIVIFHSLSELNNMIDKVTHKVNQVKLIKMFQQMSGISLSIDSGSTVPLGQIIWALMNDTDSFDNYIKSYFTIFVEYIIHSSPNYFTFCPNHPEFVYKIPKSETLKCSCKTCQMIYCCKCKNWHKTEEPCERKCSPEDNIKFCPRCLKPIAVCSDSGILTCNCGAIFCAKCGDKSRIFNSPMEAYEHINNVHSRNKT